MKTKLIVISFLFLLFSFTSCETKTKEKDKSISNAETEILINKIDMHEIQIIEIDNCEYIFYKKSPNTNKGFGFMAHKGNCKNTIHYYSRSKEEH